MKKFHSVAITQPIDLGGYHESYAGQIVHVWVNPPRSVRKEREDLLLSYAEFFRSLSVDAVRPTRKKHRLIGLIDLFANGFQTTDEKRLRATERRVYAFFAQLWSQHPNTDTHWSASNIESVNDADPALFAWLVRESTRSIDTFRSDKKK